MFYFEGYFLGVQDVLCRQRIRRYVCKVGVISKLINQKGMELIDYEDIQWSVCFKMLEMRRKG